MASSNVLGIQDAYALMNAVATQALGRTNLTAVDSSTFVTVGEAVMQTGLESTLNAIGLVLGRTIFGVRPYRAKLSTLERDAERFGLITRKITYLYMEAEKSNDWNTQVDGTQLADGASVDMYKINAPKAMQLSFPGAQSLQRHITRFRDQLRIAFSNESEFLQFWEAAMVEFYNQIERQKEDKSRIVLCNRIAGQKVMGQGVVDLAQEFNTENNTGYTREELLTAHADAFWKYVTARIKIDSDRLTDVSTKNHAQLSGYADITRHTPKDRQRMIMYNPAFIGAKANVWSTLFNPEYLNIGDFEGVNFWQSQDSPESINYKPNILNTSTGEANAAGSAVTIPYVLGILFDEEALGVMPKFDYSSVTPFNSAGGYFNIYMHWLFKMYNDYTENAIVYVIGDGGEARLSALTLGSLTLSPTFDADTYDYTTTTSNASDTVTATAADGCTAYITVNGTAHTSGQAATWTPGTNVVKVTVTKDGAKTQVYTVTVTAS